MSISYPESPGTIREHVPADTPETATSPPNVVLVVDDEASVRNVLTRGLWMAGFQCVTAESGEQALAKLCASRFAVMLCDIRMPGMDGLELLPRALAQDPDLAIIMVTALAGLETALGAIRAGAYDYVTKPFHVADVELVVHRALEYRRLRLENRRYITHLEDLVAERTKHIQATALDVITSLGLVLEAKDPWTHDHSRRVAEVALHLAEQLGVAGTECDDLRLAGLLHDLGKVGVRESVLLKDGALSASEYTHIKQHPDLGARILSPLRAVQHIIPFIRHHHERWDGGGYPDGVAGEDIPFGARILGVADAYVAMREDRPYRQGRAKTSTLAEVRIGARHQFDLHVVSALLALDRRGVLDELDRTYPDDPPMFTLVSP